MKRVALLIFILSSFPVLAKTDCNWLRGKSVDAIVVYVDDGDTATVKLSGTGKSVKIRFYGVDTPESAWPGHWPVQDYSAESKAFTTSELKNKKVKVTFTGQATYTRCVGEVFNSGYSHSLALIKGGYGWWYSKYSPNRVDLETAQDAAKKSNAGLWRSENPIAPWDFRRMHRN